MFGKLFSIFTAMMIYLDYASTSPMSKSALNAYQQAAERYFANASSLHDYGSEAQRALEGARKAIARIAGVPERGLHFTGSGSEASFLALVTLAHSAADSGRHLITTEIEHSSVRNTYDWLAGQGFEVSRIPAGPDGRVDPEHLKSTLRDSTIMVSVQHVNSETGSVQPLAEIGQILEHHQALFHSDLVQGFGKIPISPSDCKLDSFTISAHKLQGPKGIGAAWINPSLTWPSFIPGTVHEHGFRPGTVDVPAAVSFAVAVREAFAAREENQSRTAELRSLLIASLQDRLSGQIIPEGDPHHCSPYILGLRIQGMEGQFAMLECSQRGIAISTGSACQVNEQKPSATLLSMGRSEEEAKQFIRISLGPETTREEVLQAAKTLAEVIEHYRVRSGLSTL